MQELARERIGWSGQKPQLNVLYFNDETGNFHREIDGVPYETIHESQIAFIANGLREGQKMKTKIAQAMIDFVKSR